MNKKIQTKNNKLKFSLIIAFIFLSLIVIFGIILLSNQSNEEEFIVEINQQSYYAVYLNTEKVYFGKISRTYDEMIVLTDAYYIEVDAQDDNNQSSSPELRLIKRGDEIHQPHDTMFIPRESIVFFEEIKADSRVISAIKEHKGL